MSTNFKNGVTQKNLQQAYLHLSDVISSERFLTNQGLNNEVPFHICPYTPAIQTEIDRLVKQLINYLRDADATVLEINLYDLVIAVLKTEGDW